jgi:hypothetical protein
VPRPCNKGLRRAVPQGTAGARRECGESRRRIGVACAATSGYKDVAAGLWGLLTAHVRGWGNAMVYTLDSGVNLLLNLAGFTGLGDPAQILIAIVLASAAVLWNATLVPRWAMTAFFTLMFLAACVAVYALVLGRQSTCIYAYDRDKPVFADSLERKLSWQEVRQLDCATLWVARNEIYDRSNYCFFTPTAHAYFSNDATCDPAIERASSDIGNSNIGLIARMEKRKGCAAVGDSCRRLGRAASSRLQMSRPTVESEP